GQLLLLAPLPVGRSGLEAGHHALGEQPQGVADVLVPVLAGLLDEDHLIHPGIRIALAVLVDLFGRSHAAASGVLDEVLPRLLEPFPEARVTGFVDAEDAVIAEGIAEEAEAVDAARHR